MREGSFESRSTMRKFVRFLGVGSLMMVLNMVMLYGMVDLLGWPYLLATTLAFFALNLPGYILNKAFTFKLGRELLGKELTRYYLVMAVSLSLSLILMYLFVEIAGFNYLVASIFVSGMVAFLNFFGHSRYSYVSPSAAAVLTPRILQVSAFFEGHGGGIEVVAGQIAKRIARSGFYVVWMAGGPSDEVPEVSGREQVNIVHARSFDFLESRIGLPAPVWTLGSLFRLWSEVRKADVVQIHDYLYFPTLMARLFAAIQGRPVVLTQHVGRIVFRTDAKTAVLEALNRTLGRFVLSSVNQVVFVGRPVFDYFARFTSFRLEPKLISNGVAHCDYPAALRGTQTDEEVRILFVGRFVEKKGIDLLRHCVGLPFTRWVFIGAGPRSPALWKNSEGNLTLMGRLAPKEVAEQYRCADLLVLPSTGEGFPLVVQEALASGTPVLVSAEVADAFPYKDPSCVFSVELRTEDPVGALKEGIRRCIADRKALAKARCDAVRLAAQWSWERCVEEYSAIYRDVVRRRTALGLVQGC